MQLNSIASSELSLRMTEPSRGERPAANQVDQAAFPAVEGLNDALTHTPEARAEVVARAAALVSSVKYPPAELIAGISHLLAENWPGPQE